MGIIYNTHPLAQARDLYCKDPASSLARAWDRGAADSYYRRGAEPNYYMNKNNMDGHVTEWFMSAEEKAAYQAGYDYNEYIEDFKDWGRDD